MPPKPTTKSEPRRNLKERVRELRKQIGWLEVEMGKRTVKGKKKLTARRARTIRKLKSCFRELRGKNKFTLGKLWALREKCCSGSETETS